MYKISHLTYQVDGALLLNDLSFEIGAGEYVAIVGPNAAGKTTLLRCLDRLITDWTGDILLDGRSSRSYSRRELAQKVAFVRQIPELPPFTVRQYITLCRFPHLGPFAPMTELDYNIIDEAMSRTGMDLLADRFLTTLSGGECRKAFLAAAIAQQTPILILDELSAFLDYGHQKEINLLLAQLNKESGRTIIEVTHDLNSAALSADHLLAIRSGHLVFDGAPEDLMQKEKLRALFQTDLLTVPHPQKGIPMIVPQ